MVLRDRDSSRCGCLADVGKVSLRFACRICVPDPCRNRIDPETICWRTLKARTLLVVESVERAAKPDPHKRDYVRAGWNFERIAVEMARAVGRCGIEHRY